VTKTVLKSGEEIQSDIVVVGVGARPNIELIKGQVDLLEEKPGGIKVIFSHFSCHISARMLSTELIMRPNIGLIKGLTVLLHNRLWHQGL
jgi:hypothetical protein